MHADGRACRVASGTLVRLRKGSWWLGRCMDARVLRNSKHTCPTLEENPRSSADAMPPQECVKCAHHHKCLRVPVLEKIVWPPTFLLKQRVMLWPMRNVMGSVNTLGVMSANCLQPSGRIARLLSCFYTLLQVLLIVSNTEP